MYYVIKRWKLTKLRFSIKSGIWNIFSKKTIWQQSLRYQAFQKLNLEHPSFAFQSVIPEMLSLGVILNEIIIRTSRESWSGIKESKQIVSRILSDNEVSVPSLRTLEIFSPPCLKNVLKPKTSKGKNNIMVYLSDFSNCNM